MTRVASLTVNSTVSQSLGEATDYYSQRNGRYYDYYRLTNLTPGQRVTVSLNSNRFDTYLYLMNAETGRIVARDDDSGAGTNSRLSFTPTFGDQGSYYVIASSCAPNSTGAYTLSVYQPSSLA